MINAVAPRLFGGQRVLAFDHRFDTMDGGVEGLAERALAVLDVDPGGDASALVRGESLGETAALMLAHRHPTRVRGLILLSAFVGYPRVFAYLPRLHLRLWRIVRNGWGERLLKYVAATDAARSAWLELLAWGRARLFTLSAHRCGSLSREMRDCAELRRAAMAWKPSPAPH